MTETVSESWALFVATIHDSGFSTKKGDMDNTYLKMVLDGSPDGVSLTLNRNFEKSRRIIAEMASSVPLNVRCITELLEIISYSAFIASHEKVEKITITDLNIMDKLLAIL